MIEINPSSWRANSRNPSLILLLVRDGTTNSLPSLLKYFRIDDVPPTSQYKLRRNVEAVLHELMEAGLITEEDGVYTTTTLVPKIQSALGLSLTELSQKPLDAMMIAPLFGKPDVHVAGQDIFVLMPFSADMRPIYTDHILRAANELGLSVARADDFYTTHEIMRDVWQGITACKLIVADCTGRNPNVFYEIGIAHTIGKPVILITQTMEDIPLDLRHRRVIEYKYTPPGMVEFEKQLIATIKSTLGG
jgi:hypothetical protein